MTKNQKREIKRLMALGIQRNDAAGYLKASRIIEAKGYRPRDYIQPLPIIAHQREIKRLAVQHTCSWQIENTLQGEEKKRYIYSKLGAALGNALLDRGLCSVSACATMDYNIPVVTYRATIDVAVPQEVQA